jgi:diguanylate cyclase (GGDEF)-like protein
MARLLLNMREHRKPVSLVLVSLLVLLIGILDRWAGSEIEFGVIYLIPALLAAIINRRFGLVIAFACALMAFIVDLFVIGHTTNFVFYLWDFFSNAALFSLIAFLLSDLIRSRQYEHELARTDSLTGAMNVRAFYELAETEIDRAGRYKHPFTVAYMDVDNFKIINDTLGHDMGNRLLCTLVTSIKRRVRKTDIVARLGGDEFALLLPEADQEAAQIVIDGIQNQLTDEIHKNNWSVTFSIGVITFAEMPPTVEKMIEAADTLMYAVKQNGKNSIKYSTYAG